MHDKFDLILKKLENIEERLSELEKTVSNLTFLHNSDSQDHLFPEAVEYIQHLDKVSASDLQRQFYIGYARACKILDDMELERYIDSAEGSKPRNINKDKLKEIEKQNEVLFEKTVKIIKEYDEASASLLQRRLSIGYAQAARLLDRLEKKGFIGKAEGSKPRKVLK